MEICYGRLCKDGTRTRGRPDTEKKTIEFTQKCEITLALAMLKCHLHSGVSKKKIEIGVSKACCGWYLSLLDHHIPKIQFSPCLSRETVGRLDGAAQWFEIDNKVDGAVN